MRLVLSFERFKEILKRPISLYEKTSQYDLICDFNCNADEKTIDGILYTMHQDIIDSYLRFKIKERRHTINVMAAYDRYIEELNEMNY